MTYYDIQLTSITIDSHVAVTLTIDSTIGNY